MNRLESRKSRAALAGCTLATLWALAPQPVLAVAIRIDSLAPPRKSTTGEVRSGAFLMQVTLDLAQHPDAVCNDGSLERRTLPRRPRVIGKGPP